MANEKQLLIDKLECKIQDLVQENDEERLINLQYQTTNRTLISMNKNLKNENKYLREENSTLTTKINRIENKGLKRKFNSDINENMNLIPLSDAADGSLDVLTINEKPEKRSLEEKIRQLSSNNAKLLEQKEHYKNKFDNCYNIFLTTKKDLDLVRKDYDEIRNEKISELKKDPRITSMINREKDDRIAELEAKNIDLVKRLQENQENSFLDLSCVKKERNVEEPNSEEQKTESSTKSLESDLKKIKEFEKKIKELSSANKLLDDSLNKKTAELDKLIDSFKMLKTKAEIQKQTVDEDKKRILILEEEIKKLQDDKEKLEKEHQVAIKDLEQKSELNSVKLKQQYEFQLNKVKSDHESEINNLKSELEKKSNEAKESDTSNSKIKELTEQLKIKSDEVEKFKMLYKKIEEESHKKTSLINLLNKETRDLKGQYDIINENNILYKEKLSTTGSMLETKILENKILEAQVNQLRRQVLNNLGNSPRGYHTPPQNLSCSSSPTIQQQQQNQMLNNSSSTNMLNTSVSQLLNNSQSQFFSNSSNLVLPNNVNNMNNLVIPQSAINSSLNMPEISPPSYNFIRQNQNSNLMNLLIQQQLSVNDQQQQQHQQNQFLQQQMQTNDNQQLNGETKPVTIPTNNQTDSPSSPDNNGDKK